MALRIAQVTDLHLLDSGEHLMHLDVNERLERVLRHASALDPDAYFLTGDFCARDPEQEVYHRLRPVLDALHKPYYLAPGNHDNRQMMRNAFFLEGHGESPIKGLVRVKGRDFLFLDSSAGVVDDEQVNWLAKAITIYPEAAVVMHHPPVLMGVPFMDNKYPLRDTQNLLHILTSDGRRRRIFCGHYHTSRAVNHENLEVFLCPPTSFFLDSTHPEFKQEHLPPGYQMMEWTDDGDFRCVPYYVGECGGEES